MSFQDKLLHCSACGATFTFSAEKQGFFQSWGYADEPRYCPSCRQAMKSKRYGTGGYGSSDRRQMFQATCASCGKKTEVPFEPRTGRQVYCSACYRKVRLYR